MRCFLGFKPDPVAMTALLQHIDRLDGYWFQQTQLSGSDGAKTARLHWQNSNQLHLTLQFLGTVDPEKVVAITPAVRVLCHQISPLPIRGNDIHLFPSPRKAHCLVLTIATNRALEELYDEAGVICRASGIPVEHRRYRPHLTLARIKSGGRDLPPQWPSLDLSFSAESLTLFSSHATAEGSRYDEVEAFPLSGE